MRIVRFSCNDNTAYGTVNNHRVYQLAGKPYDEINISDKYYNIDEVRLLPPCEPSKIIAMGLNYYSHAREMDLPVPNSPLTFLKPTTALIGPEDNIVYPSASARVDYEGELALVIKKVAWRVPVSDYKQYILGYTCFNDVTARDLQKKDGQWTRAKGFDTFAAIGPWIETDIEPDSLTVETYLNNVIKQKGSISDLIYSIPEIINFISNVMTLLPGDVIATGTPAGIGPMKPGDDVIVKISKIGKLKNSVIENCR